MTLLTQTMQESGHRAGTGGWAEKRRPTPTADGRHASLRLRASRATAWAETIFDVDFPDESLDLDSSHTLENKGRHQRQSSWPA
jgi:hypothetical protein